MKNSIYESALAELATIFGSHDNLESGSGARFKSAKKGKLTIYHRDIASGNSAEIAFELDSIAARFKLSASEAATFLARLKAATGRPVEINPRFQWPRVGLATAADVATVLNALKQKAMLA